MKDSQNKFNGHWSIERTAQMAVFEALKAGKPVRVLYRGQTIEARPHSLVAQVVAEYRAKVAQ
jgi:hypothetical protein